MLDRLLAKIHGCDAAVNISNSMSDATEGKSYQEVAKRYGLVDHPLPQEKGAPCAEARSGPGSGTPSTSSDDGHDGGRHRTPLAHVHRPRRKGGRIEDVPPLAGPGDGGRAPGMTTGALEKQEICATAIIEKPGRIDVSDLASTSVRDLEPERS